MQLTETEYNKFVEIHPKLIYYVGIQKKMISKTTSLEQFLDLSVEEKYPIRNAMYENIHLLNDYLTANANQLSEEDKDIIRAFKYFKKGKFYVIKLSKKYAHFLGDKFVYGVNALSEPFQNLFGNNLPMMVEAVLLPFNGKIIYDGIVSSYSIRFGRGLKNSLKSEHAIAESKYGIITELPEKVDKNTLANSAEKELLVLMKTKASRDNNWYQIEDLLLQNPKLDIVYNRELGRINSRKKKKELRNLGIKKRWFAMFDDTIISSNSSESSLKAELNTLIADKKTLDSLYYFKI